MAYEGWSPIATKYDPLKAGSIDGTDEEPHDRGVVRALNSKYRPNRGVVGDPESTVFIAHLHPNTTEDTISDHFARYGRLKRVKLIRDIITGFSRCYAFVEYESPRDATRAQREGQKTFIDEQEIFVDYELERTLKGWIPRRLGGGFGGKKEAGQLRFGGKERPFRKPIYFDNRQISESFGEGTLGRLDTERYRSRDQIQKSYHRRSRSPDTSRATRRGRSRSPNKERSSYRGDRSPTRSHRRESRKRSRSRSKERYGRPRSGRF